MAAAEQILEVDDPLSVARMQIRCWVEGEGSFCTKKLTSLVDQRLRRTGLVEDGEEDVVWGR